METVYQEKKICCGCEACLNICPQHAITMKSDSTGSYYPIIDRLKCIECGLCIRTCSYSKNIKKVDESVNAYAAYAKNEKIIMRSASGGVFGYLAEKVLTNGGMVVGCSTFFGDEKKSLQHTIIQDINELEKLQGSKYAQSRIGEVFSVVKTKLQSGALVLFSGTPCQVAGLKGYLQNTYDNLITIDIICHGVPGNRFFMDYLELLEAREKSKILGITFRDKQQGWDLRGAYLLKNPQNKIKIKKIVPGLSSYYKYFLEGAIYRDCCYSCKYAGYERQGDLTIGDYWGIEIEEPDIVKEIGTIEKGVSCILANSSKGVDFLNSYGDGLFMRETSFGKIARHNAQLLHPSKMPSKRDTIFELYSKGGYEAVDEYFYRHLGIKKYFIQAWSFLPKKIRKYIKMKVKHSAKM